MKNFQIKKRALYTALFSVNLIIIVLFGGCLIPLLGIIFVVINF